MMNHKLILLICSAAVIASCSQTPKTADAPYSNESKVSDACFGLSSPIQNIQGRELLSLDGSWKAFVDLYETGYYDYRRNPMSDKSSFFADDSFHKDPTRLVEYDFDTAAELQVPGDWNTQRPQLYMYEGTIWYRQKFQAKPKKGERTFLYFGAANYEAVVGVNGHAIAKHVGGFTPFNIEITDRVNAGENTVIVKVDNKRRLEEVPTVNFDWWNYGGLTRSVYVVTVPETFIRDYSVTLSPDRKSIKGWIQLDGSRLAQKATIAIEELGIKAELNTNEKGYAEFNIDASPVFWTPANPKLYAVNLASESDAVSDMIGFRTIETSGTKILLNGEPIFCKGISIHEEQPNAPSGRAYSIEDAKTTLGWAKELGCNFVRLAHYPHNENMIRAAEQMGIMVWDEIPVYWTIQWDNPVTYANAAHQLEEMISRDRNRANVIFWSVANETPRGELRLDFLRRLIEKARSLDDTRLVSAAMEKEYTDSTSVTVLDELAEFADVISFNQYIGWYDGDADKCDAVKWSFPIEKPVIVTELGGGAKYGRHGDRTERFTEEYMDYLYVKNLEMLDKIDALAGTTPWILKDFRSPRRFLPGIQDDFNRKGLLSEKGEKKMAFYTYKNWR